jgi:hypothetical protein
MKQFSQQAPYGQTVAPSGLASALLVHQGHVSAGSHRQSNRLGLASIERERESQ